MGKPIQGRWPDDDEIEIPDDEMEAQPITDPDIQEDHVYERGLDGELHEVVPEEGDDDVEDA